MVLCCVGHRAVSTVPLTRLPTRRPCSAGTEQGLPFFPYVGNAGRNVCAEDSSWRFFIPTGKLLAVQMVWENLYISQTVVLSSNDVKKNSHVQNAPGITFNLKRLQSSWRHPSVIVCLCHYNKNTIVWVASIINICLTVLEAGSVRSGCCHGPALVGSLFLACRWPPCHCPHVMEGRQASSLTSSYKGANPIHEGSIIMT